MKTIQAAVVATLAVAGVAQAKMALPSGTYASVAAEDLGNGTWGTRKFTFDKDTWALTFTLYGDKALAHPVFALDVSGPFSVGAASKVQGAHNAQFRFSRKALTVFTDDAQTLKNLGFAGCGLEKGKAVDVSEKGCSFVGSVAAYGEEFDLLKLDGDTLYLGARPADGNMGVETKRPAALGAPLKRVK